MQRNRVLWGLVVAFGLTCLAYAGAAPQDKTSDDLDKEYAAKIKAMKITPFAGRKGNSDRVAVMELFTGAQCPPCVASDIAFDLLERTYKPSELVLIQYHVHIPGPDPLTNADTEARWGAYRTAHTDNGKSKLGGVPSALFNGNKIMVGGGGEANAEKKYQDYCKAVDLLLELPAEAKVTAKASRAGDLVKIEANVSDVKKAGDSLKLRLLLVEEMVKYTGGNKVRLHHQVVRAMPGGAGGVAIKDRGLNYKADVDLAELRKNLDKYLDDYAATKRPFPNKMRPMEFANLRVIALVQDDATQEILQAAQVDVRK